MLICAKHRIESVARLYVRASLGRDDGQAPKLFGEPATGAPPLEPTRITARPRSLLPAARKQNRSSRPAKPDGLVSTSDENRCGPCVRASAATSATQP